MNARGTEPKAGEATVVNIPRAEKRQPKAEAAAPQPTASQAAAPEAPAKKKGGPRRLILMIALPLVLVLGGGYFYLTGGRYEDTDNAYVQQAKVSLSADIAGRITSVNVGEDQPVKAGDVLFTIDPQPYQIALVKQGGNSNSTLDDTKLALQAAKTAVDQANQQVATATAALGGDPNIDNDKHPAVLAALAQVENAQRNLSKTTVVAPGAGIVSNVSSLNAGQFVAAGTTIATLVESDGTWVEANFKETQLADLKVGQPAEVKVAAYGNKIEGTVESIGAATGSEFSLIPAQNVTGNWVKVVQRIPVRIKLADASDVLRPGMSASVTVDTGHSTLDKMMGK